MEFGLVHCPYLGFSSGSVAWTATTLVPGIASSARFVAYSFGLNSGSLSLVSWTTIETVAVPVFAGVPWSTASTYKSIGIDEYEWSSFSLKCWWVSRGFFIPTSNPNFGSDSRSSCLLVKSHPLTGSTETGNASGLKCPEILYSISEFSPSSPS